MSEIFSQKVVTNRRTYFFDVKETREGAKYLVIGELTQVGSELERHRVMVFEESLESFIDGLSKAADFIRYGEEGEVRDEQSPASGHRADDFDGGDTRDALERIESMVRDIREHFK